VEDKATGGESDSDGQLLGAGYAQALSSQLVLGADVRYASAKTDFGTGDLESTNTEIKPTVAFTLSPIFTLGASINVVSGKADSPAGDDSFNYNTFTVGGTLHQDLWEATLALTTANEDDEDWNASSPQTISIHGRYKVMPVLTLGARFDQADYHGIEPAGTTLETESSWALILESAVSDNSRVEVAFLSTSNSGGADGDDETEFFLSGGFDLAPNMELGGQIRYLTGESDASETSGNTFALTLSMIN
jgi:long-subunit fatty acid transport protein